eukprot:CAMPEP_0183810030 /NCGR_PEP_ID=MMETSP0803_2-20130417/46559_1 /TAXON_ID=195967 /ORGANISM="Crustomastix stigmata, Strain CCMP3273" /LENGTH=322 /DNA_ID=CAMNT_0026054839 /DNA_START=56 /DNA_END=1024 /DNA_ORIENTATION=-
MALLVTVNLASIVCVCLGTFQLIGWELGAVEAISVSVLVGLTCDSCLHLSQAYSNAPYLRRRARANYAVETIASPIVAGAATTILAVLPMNACSITLFRKFGVIIAVTLASSIFYALVLFFPLLVGFGPIPLAYQPGNTMKLLQGALWGRPIPRLVTSLVFIWITAVCFPTGRKYVLGEGWWTGLVLCLAVATFLAEQVVRFVHKRNMTTSWVPASELAIMQSDEQQRDGGYRSGPSPAVSARLPDVHVVDLVEPTTTGALEQDRAAVFEPTPVLPPPTAEPGHQQLPPVAVPAVAQQAESSQSAPQPQQGARGEQVVDVVV